MRPASNLWELRISPRLRALVQIDNERANVLAVARPDFFEKLASSELSLTVTRAASVSTFFRSSQSISSLRRTLVTLNGNVGAATHVGTEVSLWGDFLDLSGYGLNIPAAPRAIQLRGKNRSAKTVIRSMGRESVRPPP